VEDVYFIAAPEASRTKIGISKDVRSRLKQLSSAGPCALELVHVVPGGGWKLEQELHAALAQWHSHSEWFHGVFTEETAVSWVDAITSASRHCDAHARRSLESIVRSCIDAGLDARADVRRFEEAATLPHHHAFAFEMQRLLCG
jgi:hypothetical protein